MPQALILKKPDSKPDGPIYYGLQLIDTPKPTPTTNQLLIKLSAAALNHRDLFIRQHLYPGISFTTPLLADGSGTVLALGPAATKTHLLNQPVVLAPSLGWAADPSGPESGAGVHVIGATKLGPEGTAQEYIALSEDEVELAPAHLSAVESAALPLVGLTAWRALVSKSGNAEAGRNILVTGIGGGVALAALQFGVARGCRVFVTSSDETKLARAKELGAAGGVSYKSPDWEKTLAGLLPADRPYLDAVIDGAAGDIVARTVRLLKQGGVIVQYGMTQGPKMEWNMQAVLKNVELKGTTMGSRREFAEMMAFVREKGIKPVVSRVVKGLDVEAIDGLFEDMKSGRQFGKLVVDIAAGEDSSARL